MYSIWLRYAPERKLSVHTRSLVRLLGPEVTGLPGLHPAADARVRTWAFGTGPGVVISDRSEEALT
jgi:hypothetical protein